MQILKSLRLFFIGSLFMVLLSIGCGNASEVQGRNPSMVPHSMDSGTTPTETRDPASTIDFLDESYSAVLSTYVDEEGRVNYRALKANRHDLESFVNALDSLEEKTYRQFSETRKIAFWINAYNGLTLKAIVDHYPIESSLLGSIRFPKNSIRQISGVWDELAFSVMDRKMTLDEIEHEVLRKQFKEPRIHMALVCAAISCPKLRNEPYSGDRLDEQLDDQARSFLLHPGKFRIDRNRDKVSLSPIFKWFGEDFISRYGTNERFSSFSEKERAVLNFVHSFVDDETASYLTTQSYSIEYLDYDWNLNEQK